MSSPAAVDHAWWLASRASAIVALYLVTLSVGVGLAMAGRLVRRPGVAPRMRALHEHAALIALVMIVMHATTLLGDQWLRPGAAGVAVPFVLAYRPAFTAMGIIAAYLAAALGLSYYARRRLGARRWRRVHRLTIAVYVLGVVHALGAGTDTGGPWARAAILATAVPIGGLLVRRLAVAHRRIGAGPSRSIAARGVSR
jgi:methionine sulfoxide reductase heme-binding subunit